MRSSFVLASGHLDGIVLIAISVAPVYGLIGHAELVAACYSAML